MSETIISRRCRIYRDQGPAFLKGLDGAVTAINGKNQIDSRGHVYAVSDLRGDRFSFDILMRVLGDPVVHACWGQHPSSGSGSVHVWNKAGFTEGFESRSFDTFWESGGADPVMITVPHDSEDSDAIPVKVHAWALRDVLGITDADLVVDIRMRDGGVGLAAAAIGCRYIGVEGSEARHDAAGRALSDAWGFSMFAGAA